MNSTRNSLARLRFTENVSVCHTNSWFFDVLVMVMTSAENQFVVSLNTGKKSLV